MRDEYPRLIALASPKGGTGKTTLIKPLVELAKVLGMDHPESLSISGEVPLTPLKPPPDFKTISDLQKFIPLFHKRGYSEKDVENIMYGNWLRFIRNAWG